MCDAPGYALTARPAGALPEPGPLGHRRPGFRPVWPAEQTASTPARLMYRGRNDNQRPIRVG